jgi:hypothetical protein
MSATRSPQSKYSGQSGSSSSPSAVVRTILNCRPISSVQNASAMRTGRQPQPTVRRNWTNAIDTRVAANMSLPTPRKA